MNDSFDDDATVIRPSGAGLSAVPAAEGANALPVGTQLGEFEITGVLGEGGFGIVYLAQDHALERRVALKEYMPSALALRGDGAQVMVRSERHRDTYAAGLKSFVNEARLLARFDHRSLVKVYRFWEADGTAYMVMPFVEGRTLKDSLRDSGAPPSEDWLMALLAPLTEALQVLHAENIYHRDIAPDNIIMLEGSGLPLLLDFGAARRVIGDMTQALTVILKPGYAPVEQYAEVPSMKQGPWTDVYALAAVVYFALTGRTPPASVGRLVSDDYQPLAQQTQGGYSVRLCAAVDRALRVRPEDRTPSIDAFREDLGLPPRVAPGASSAVDSVTLLRPALAGAQTLSSAPNASNARPHRAWWLAGAAAGALAFFAAAASLVFGRYGAAPADVAASVPAAASASQAAPPTAPPTAPRTAPPTTLPTTPPTASQSAPTNALPGSLQDSAPAAAHAPPPALATQFDRLVATQTPGFDVSAHAERARLRVDTDDLRFSIESKRDGYVTVLVLGPDGVLNRIYPNAKAKDNRIQAGRALALPQAAWPLRASEPTGIERFLVLVTPQPRSYAALTIEQDAAYGFLTLPAAAPPGSAFEGASSWLLGQPDCGRPDCGGDYGAAVFSVEVVKR